MLRSSDRDPQLHLPALCEELDGSVTAAAQNPPLLPSRFRVGWRIKGVHMSTSRIVLAGVLGGIAMFAWMSVAHMVLPLGSTGIGEINRNEPALLAEMHNALGEYSGLYMFPSFGSKPGDRSAAP